MNCPKCQKPLAANARFCDACGAAIAPEPAPEPSGGPAATAAWAAPSAALPAVPGLLQRIKNILISPRTEWTVIAGEQTAAAQLFGGYVVPLVVFAAVLNFLHLSVFGVSLPFGGSFRTPLLHGLEMAVLTVVFGIIGVFLIGLVINALAPTFGGSRDQRRALQAAAYSLTPALLGAVLALSPILPSLLQLAAGCYGIYVLFLGLPVLMRSPPERAVGYTATVVICTLLVGIVLSIASAGLGLTGRAGLMSRPAGRPGTGGGRRRQRRGWCARHHPAGQGATGRGTEQPGQGQRAEPGDHGHGDDSCHGRHGRRRQRPPEPRRRRRRPDERTGWGHGR